jgi:hypothetical protein
MNRRINPVVAIGVTLFAAIMLIGLFAFNSQRIVSMRYYPQTGHLVREPFLSFVEAHGGVEMLGYPLTDAHTDQGGTLVQTFEHAHIQLTVRGIELASVGVLMGLGSQSSSASVGPEFTAFYDLHGGQAFFGLPLGIPRHEDGNLVQDFERARLVHDSEGQIQLADLGKAYLALVPDTSQSGALAFRINGTITPPSSVRVSVSVASPTVSVGAQQTIYLYVEDEENNPVEGAESLAILKYNNGSGEISLLPTDRKGLASARFIVPPAPPGSRVMVKMHILVGETYLTVETSYIQWW